MAPPRPLVGLVGGMSASSARFFGWRLGRPPLRGGMCWFPAYTRLLGFARCLGGGQMQAMQCMCRPSAPCGCLRAPLRFWHSLGPTLPCCGGLVRWSAGPAAGPPAPARCLPALPRPAALCRLPPARGPPPPALALRPPVRLPHIVARKCICGSIGVSSLASPFPNLVHSNLVHAMLGCFVWLRTALMLIRSFQD